MILLLSVAFLASTAVAGSRNHKRFGWSNTMGCEVLIQSRASAVAAMTSAATGTVEDDLEYFLAIGTYQFLSAAIQSQSCCTNTQVASWFVTNYAAGVSGPVCGYDFNTYSTPAAACAAGIYHTGACFGGYTNLPCYQLPTPQATQCVLGMVQSVVLGEHIFAQNPDFVLASQFPVCNPAPTSNDYLYRHAEGYCNNLGKAPVTIPGVSNIDFRWSGAAGNLFVHEATVLPTNPQTYIQTGPNPRDISNAMFTQSAPIPNPNGVNGLIMAHVNFFVHDFMNHKNDDWYHPIAVPISATDPVWGAGSSWGRNINWFTTQAVMLIPGTESDVGPFGTPSTGFPYRRDLSTAWFDCSQVYGSDTATTLSLRALSGGLMKMQQTNVGWLLPDNVPGQYVNKPFMAGDARVNFHPGLTAMHTLWVREHNRLAGTIQFLNPTWTDEQIFQTARLILSAEVIKIHTLEWTNALALAPADQAVTAYLYSQFGCPQPSAFTRATHVVPEEFVAVYKWHSFVPPTLQLKNPASGANTGNPIDYVGQFQDTTVIRTNGIEPVIVGLAMAPTGTMRFNNLAPGLQNIKHPFLLKPSTVPFTQPNCVVVPGLDFAVIDIVRDRERGILKYNGMRALVSLGQLPAANYFDDIADTPTQAFALATLYRWNIQTVDSYVGFHGEHMLPGQGFPVTVAAAFVPFVIARAQLDRFYTDNFDLTHYTGYGIMRLAYVDFAQILCDNAGICNVPDRTKTFFVWDPTHMGTRTITPGSLGNVPATGPVPPSPPSCPPPS
jgi:hypothetical protein